MGGTRYTRVSGVGVRSGAVDAALEDVIDNLYALICFLQGVHARLVFVERSIELVRRQFERVAHLRMPLVLLALGVA